MKQQIKKILFDIVYQLYQHHVLHNKLFVFSIEETIDLLRNSDKSIVRFGDGEIRYIEGHSGEFQEYDKSLATSLHEILQFKNEKLLVAIPGIFGSLDMFTEKSGNFWKEHLFFYRRIYEKNCDVNKRYYNAFISRPYYICKNKEMCGTWFKKIKEIWDGKEVVVVEGAVSHNGVGNDLFDNAAKVYRIICPSKDAYCSYERILSACMSFGKEKLILTSVGMTAKALTRDLVEQGDRVLDIGNLDMEYEWYLQRTENKVALAKHKCLSEEENRKAGYHEYLSEIVCRIENQIVD